MGDLTWAERLKERVKNKQEECLYWVARGCCVESYRRKCVEKGLVPEQVVPMSEEDKAHFRMTLETPAMPKIKEKPKKKEPVDEGGEEYEIVLQKLAREQMKKKLLADILLDMEICKLKNWDHTEYIGQLRQMLGNIKMGDEK